MEVAKLLSPLSELCGYDTNLSMFPAQGWLPPNVSGFEWDAFSEVPIDAVGRFDLVHIGIFMLVIANNNPIPLLKNLMKMLSQSLLLC